MEQESTAKTETARFSMTVRLFQFLTDQAFLPVRAAQLTLVLFCVFCAAMPHIHNGAHNGVHDLVDGTLSRFVVRDFASCADFPSVFRFQRHLRQ